MKNDTYNMTTDLKETIAMVDVKCSLAMVFSALSKNVCAFKARKKEGKKEMPLGLNLGSKSLQ